MTRSVVAVDIDAPLSDALALISSRRVACLPVLDDDHRVAGMVDERQVLRALVTGAADTVGQLLDGRCVCVDESTPAHVVAADLLDQDVPGAAVVSAQGELVGILTRGDALRALLRERARDQSVADVDGWRVRVSDGVVTVEGAALTRFSPAGVAG